MSETSSSESEKPAETAPPPSPRTRATVAAEPQAAPEQQAAPESTYGPSDIAAAWQALGIHSWEAGAIFNMAGKEEMTMTEFDAALVQWRTVPTEPTPEE